MTRLNLRYALMACLLASAAFAGWSWLRPYSWKSDTGARCKVVETLVTRDQSFFWLNVHLKVNPGATHELQKPVRLQTARSVILEPADTTFAGNEGQPITEIWFKFWLEAADLDGPLSLILNDGRLTIKSGKSVPDLGNATYRNFTTDRW